MVANLEGLRERNANEEINKRPMTAAAGGDTKGSSS